jgi:hypothetical protein
VQSLISSANIAEKDYERINKNLQKISQHDKKIVCVDTNDERREEKFLTRRGYQLLG